MIMCKLKLGIISIFCIVTFMQGQAKTNTDESNSVCILNDTAKDIKLQNIEFEYLIGGGKWFIPHIADINITFNNDSTFIFNDLNTETEEIEVLCGKFELNGNQLILKYNDRTEQTFKFKQGKGADDNYYITRGKTYYFVSEDKYPSFQELIKMDSLTDGVQGMHINNYFTLSEQFYFEVISDKGELYKIIKWADGSPVKDFLLLNFKYFTFEKTDKNTLQVFFKGNLLTIIQGTDHCYKPYQNAGVLFKVLLFDNQGHCIIKGDKLKKSFKKQLFEIYNKLKVSAEVIVDDELTYKHHIILQYTISEGLHSFCDNYQFDKSSIIYKRIEELCKSFCKANKLEKIIFDSYVFQDLNEEIIPCCSPSDTTSNHIRDINGCTIIEKIDSSKVYYVREDGGKLIANLGGLEFDGGKDSLKTYLDSVFYNNPDYHNHSEFNVLENFFILFDENMNIEEVRIMYRNYADNKRFYYDSVFVNALKTSTGRWHKTVSNNGWYTKFHRHRIYYKIFNP